MMQCRTLTITTGGIYNEEQGLNMCKNQGAESCTMELSLNFKLQ